MKKQLTTLGLSIILSSFVWSSSANAATFTNGGFEASTYTGYYSYQTVNTGGTNIYGWSILSGSVDYIYSLWESSDGVHSLDLSGNSAGAISQTFDTEVGTTYVIKFDIAGNTAGGSVIKGIQVTIGNEVLTYYFDTTGSSNTDMNWITEEFLYTATDTSSTLTFTSLTDSGYGVALDNVRVEALDNAVPNPEPSSLILSLVGAGSALRFRRRKKDSLDK